MEVICDHHSSLCYLGQVSHSRSDSMAASGDSQVLQVDTLAGLTVLPARLSISREAKCSCAYRLPTITQSNASLPRADILDYGWEMN